MSIHTGDQSGATRITEWGVENALFLGDPGDRVFATMHLPAALAVGAVLVCPSLFTDTIINYGREVELARILASQGVAVARFHYRGTGQSEGEPLETTFSSMVADAHRVASYLGQVSSCSRIAALGSRWGALVASEFVEDGVPIAFWEPVLAGNSFFAEALQASGVAHMTSELGGLNPKQQLAAQGVANILGFPMGQALFDSGTDITLVETLGSKSSSVLYGAPERKSGMPKSHGGAVEQLLGNGLTVTARGMQGPPAWWFVADTGSTPLDAAAPTASWFLEVMREDPE